MTLDPQVSLALRPPAPRCTGCAGPLAGPPWLTDTLRRQVFCDACATADGHAELVERVAAVRRVLATAADDTAEAACRALRDDW